MKISESICVVENGAEGEVKQEKEEENKIEYTWEEHGLPLMEKLDTLIDFNNEEKDILRALFKSDTIPDKYHKEIWFISSGAKRQMLNNVGYYKDLVDNFPNYIPLTMENQINLDLNRTFPTDPFFKNNDLNLQRLKKILLAYSKRNIAIGYCQGFNFIVGFFLEMYDNEEKVFWLFAQIMENILPPDYYIALSGVCIDTSMILDLLRGEMKKFSEKHQIYFYNKILTTLISLYVKNMNKMSLTALFDYIFLDGLLALYQSILYFARHIININDSIGISLDFSEYRQFNDDILIDLPYQEITKFREYAFSEIEPKKKENILKRFLLLRMKYKKSIMDEIMNTMKSKKAKSDNDLIKNSFIHVDYCDLDWPLCIYDIDYRFNYVEYFIFKTLKKPNLIDDYFFTDCHCEHFDKIKVIKNKSIIDEAEQYHIFADLLIERRKHICNSKNRIGDRIFKIFEMNEKENKENFFKQQHTLAVEQSKRFDNEMMESSVFVTMAMCKKVKEEEKEEEDEFEDLDNFLKENNLGEGLSSSIILEEEDEKKK